MSRYIGMAVLGASLLAYAAFGQDDSRMEKVEKQIEKLTKELERMKQSNLDRRIDDLRNRLLFDEAEAKTQKPTAGYKRGFYIQSDDEQFLLKFGGRVQLDWWMYEGGVLEPWGGAQYNNNFFIRRAYLEAGGHMWGKQHEYKIQMDFAGGSTNELKDAWMNFNYVPWLNVKVGQFKMPFGREELQSSKDIQFVERSLTNDNLVPSREAGAMLHGKLLDDKLEYATAISNGVWARNTNNNNDQFDWTYRFVLKPFKGSKNEWLEGFELGHDSTIGQQPRGVGLRGRTAGDVDWYNGGTVSGNPFRDPTGNASGVLRYDTRTGAGVDGAWYIGPFGLTGEYIHVSEFRHNVDTYLGGANKASYSDIEHGGWYVTASYILTGEKKDAKHVVPNKNFDPVKGGWGAWEIAARIEQIEEQSKDPLFRYTYTDTWGNQRTNWYDHVQDTAFTLGVNWYLNPNMVVKWNWVHDRFDERLMSPEGDIDTFMTRFQIYW